MITTALFKCYNCQTLTTDPAAQLTAIRNKGGVSCCPERKMEAVPRLLSERDLETLWTLSPNCRDDDTGKWFMPMDVGAWNSSHHSHTFKKLWRKHLVEVRSKWSQTTEPAKAWPKSGPKLYRVSPMGMWLLLEMFPEWKTMAEQEAHLKSIRKGARP